MPIDSGGWEETSTTAVMDRFTQRQLERSARQTATEVFDDTERESRRLAQRAEAHRRMAESIRASERLSEIDSAINSVNDEKDTLASEHVSACQPLQAELKIIEDAAIEAITSRQPTDSAQEQRRRELLAEIEDHNQSLEAAIAAKDRILGRLAEERRTIAHQCNEALVRIDLMRLASPQTKEALAAATSARTWAERRHAVAAEKVEIHPRSSAWCGELKAARAELDRCNAAVAGLEEKMLTE